MLTTTLNKIKEFSPCVSGWATILKGLNKTKADDEPLTLGTILKINGIEDSVWVLRVFDYKEYCLFLADVAGSVLSIFEARYPKDKRPRVAIEAIKDFHAGKVTKEGLKVYAYAASAASEAAYVASAASAASVASAASAASAAYEAASAASEAASAASAASVASAASALRKDKWVEIESLFINHFIKIQTK